MCCSASFSRVLRLLGGFAVEISFCGLLIGLSSDASAQSLDETLRQIPVAELVAKAKAEAKAIAALLR